MRTTRHSTPSGATRGEQGAEEEGKRGRIKGSEEERGKKLEKGDDEWRRTTA